MHLPDEAQLIQQVKQRAHQAEAFHTLYAHYYPRVFAYTAYRVGQRDDAEDIVSEVFIRALQSIGRFEYRGAGSFAAWLFRIAYHEISRFYSQRQRLYGAVALDDAPEMISDEPGPDAALMRKERFLRLRAAIAGLSPRRQEIVTLRFFGELRNQEIASVLGLDERTVASHLSRALEDLQRQFQDESFSERDDEPQSQSRKRR